VNVHTDRETREESLAQILEYLKGQGLIGE